MLYLNVDVGDALSIDGGRIVVHFERRAGKDVRVGISAPREVAVKLVPRERPEPWDKGVTPPNRNQPRKSEAAK